MGLITNVGTSHIELLGSRENIARAKAELFDALPAGGIAFVNADDDYARSCATSAACDERGVRTVFYDGSGANAPPCRRARHRPMRRPVRVGDRHRLDERAPHVHDERRHFEQMGLPEANGAHACTLELRGAHNVSNACAAAAVGPGEGMTLEQCCAALGARAARAGPPAGASTAGGRHGRRRRLQRQPRFHARVACDVRGDGSGGAAHRRARRHGRAGRFRVGMPRARGRRSRASGLDVLVCVGELVALIAAAAPRAAWTAARIHRRADADEAARRSRARACRRAMRCS